MIVRTLLWNPIRRELIPVSLIDKAVSTDEEEGRVALNSPYRDNGANDESRVALLDTELPTTTRPKRKSSCCVCCGLEYVATNV
jgi:hypothetical protein